MDDIINFLTNNLNYDLALLIIKKKEYLENIQFCNICNKKKDPNKIINNTYLCSEDCQYCGMCIGYITCQDCKVNF